MQLSELKARIDQLVEDGHGTKDVIVTEGAACRSWEPESISVHHIVRPSPENDTTMHHFSGPLCNSLVGDVFVELSLED